MSRGILTQETKDKFNITLPELRLLPYLQCCLLNHHPIDPRRITSEERDILRAWRDDGKITFSSTCPPTISKEFWDYMNEVLWESYVPQLETEDRCLPEIEQ